MKQQEVFKKIGVIVKELNDQYNYLSASDEHLNDLELELFVANAHFLADHSEILRKLNLQSAPLPILLPVPEPEPIHEEKYFEPVVQQVKPVAEHEVEIEELPVSLPADTPAEPVEEEQVDNHTEFTPAPHIDLQGNGADDDFSFVRQEEPETIRHELIIDESENWDEDDEGFLSDEVIEAVEEEEEREEKEDITPEQIIEPEPEEPVVETPVVVESKKSEPKIEAPDEEPLTINQMLSAQLGKQETRTVEQPHTQAITDLKQAITLNDKLLYIKDLFNGYNLAYSEAIDILNRFTNFDEAEKYLQNTYAVKNGWDTKQATVDKFYGLLRKRYL